MMVEMKTEGVLPDVLTYNTLIDGYGHMGYMDRAFHVLKQMIDESLEPNYWTYSIFLKHLFNRNLLDAIAVDIVDVWKLIKVDFVLDLLEEMAQHNCKPRLNTYNALIYGFCRAYRLEESYQLLSCMKEEGLSPNEETYTSLISCCCNLKRFTEASRFIDAIVECGSLPYLSSYRLLICGLCDEEMFEEAKIVFCKLTRSGFNHDEIVWEVILDGLHRKGHGNVSLELLSTLEESNCCPSDQTYAMVDKGRWLKPSYVLEPGLSNGFHCNLTKACAV
ncbi:hypothetical protein J5N97_005246 [Dioscorea zingiberensis]|uniref:Pentatricopeptide repeat-containing protein n=1 Tax=Dioscorea zingiberensis TaxID=325984 RepID=A0A9D5DA43_9LILI|nr:hypothetical protein J5N97_005246 [Dioscorea zingiberensis]